MKYLGILLIVVSSNALGNNFKNDMSYIVGKHPYDVIKDKRVLDALPKNIPKSEWKKIKDRLTVGTTITKNNNFVILEGCKAHFCNSDAAIVVFDNLNKHSYAAYIENIDGTLGAPNVQIYQNAGLDPNKIQPIYKFMKDHKVSMTTEFEKE